MPHPVTVMIILDVPGHNLSPGKNAVRSKPGDPVTVFRSNAYNGAGEAQTTYNNETGSYHMVDSPVGGKWGFVHIKDVPDNLTIESLRDKLLSPAEETLFTFDPPKENLLRKKACRIPLDKLPDSANKETLLNARELTLDWNMFKQIIRKKIINTDDKYNSSIDDESVIMLDEDFV